MDATQFNEQSSVTAQSAGNRVQQDFARIGSDLIDALGARAEEIVTEQKSRAANEIASFASMLRNATQRGESSQRSAVSDYADRAAVEIDRFADRLRISSWRALAADAEDFARRSPTLFMAGSALAGFLLGRVLAAPTETGPASTSWSPAPIGAEPSSRPEDGALGGTLTGGGAATGFGLPAGEETL